MTRNPYWPLFDLEVRTPRLTLRLPTPSDLIELAALAADGVHDPERMPFFVPWTDGTSEDRARSTLQHHWSTWASWKPTAWACEFVTLVDGVVVGMQALTAVEFGVLGEVHTGSWIGKAHHGRGIGTEMRAAVLHLAFEGLSAVTATSGAFEDNHASYAVSQKLGVPTGRDQSARRARRSDRRPPVAARPSGLDLGSP